MTKRVYLIDCPGIVYNPEETDTDKVLKGVVRHEKIPQPDFYVGAILEKVKPKNLYDVYGVTEWTDPEDFMTQVAKKTGKLKRGGDPDLDTVSKQIISDF